MLNTWKTRLSTGFRGMKLEPKKNPYADLSIEQIKEKLKELALSAGEKQFTKAVIEAELLQINQELLNLRNEGVSREKAQAETK